MKLTKAQAASIKEMAERIKTQDNMATSHPIFNVYERVMDKDDPEEVVEERHVQPFMTAFGVQEYLKAHGNDLENPFMYVTSGWRNREWQMLREIIAAIAEEL